MQNPKSRQYKHAKSRYRVKNWGECADLTVWLSEEAQEYPHQQDLHRSNRPQWG